MARPKEYNRTKVVAAATQLFWRKGYHGTPLSELVAVTGLNKHSLYKEFGNKEGLFNECLNHYRHTVGKEFLEILTKKPLGLSNIKDFLDNRARFMSSNEFQSCLLVKCMIEKELVENSSFKEVNVMQEGMGKAFTVCLEAAVKNGELPQSADIKLISLYLNCFALGMNILGTAENDKEELERMIEMMMSTIST